MPGDGVEVQLFSFASCERQVEDNMANSDDSARSHFRLERNMINDAGAIAIAKALKVNQTIQTLGYVTSLNLNFI